MRLPHPSTCLCTVLVTLAAALPLRAQNNDALIRQDIDYARGLAASWGFTDMAEAVVARLEKANPSGKLGDDVQLLKCDIYAISANRVSDHAKRDELLKTALTSYDQYVTSHPSAANKERAEASYVDTALNYGRSLTMAAEEAAGAELEAIKKTLQESLTKAVAKTGELQTEMESKETRTEEEDRQLFELVMNRGALLLLIARSQSDGTFNYAQAKTAYEHVVDMAGETSSAGLRAFIGVGDVYLAQGKPKDAYDCYVFVGDVAIPRDAAVWAEELKDLPPEEVQRRFALLQLATPGTINALMAAGDAPKACAEGMRMLNVWNHEGLELIPPYGYQSLLGIVGALNDAGGFIGGDLKAGTVEWFAGAEAMQAKFPQKRQQRSALDLALALAQQVNDENRGNSYGARAQRLIGELIEQPGVEVSPDILIEAARGKANDRDFLGAITGYKRVMTAVESADTAVRAEYTPKVLNAIGRCYIGLDRPLEAALVFQEAVTTFAGDPEFDPLNANGFLNAANQLKRKIKGDTVIDALSTAADAAKLKFPGEGSGAGDILYGQAARAYDGEKDYAKARELFKSVPPDAESYEKALVYIGVCEYQLGRESKEFAAAIKAFDDYLNKYLKDPAHVLGATEMRKEARRGEATATAVFYWGTCEYLMAEADKGDWKKVVDILKGYETRFPTQDKFGPAAMLRVIIAYYHLGNQAEVDATYAKMRERFPTDRSTVTAALEIYDMLDVDYKKVKDSKEPAEEAKAKALLLKMAQYLEFANQNASTPTFKNLRAESQLWMELEDWAKAEALLVKLKDKFSSGPDAEDVTKYVLPDLGIAYFRQQKMKEAVEVLGPLVDENKASAKHTLIYARALSGYAEQTFEDGKPKSMRVIAGIGGEAGFTRAEELYARLLETEKNRAEGGAWQRGWLDIKFDQIYSLIQHSKLDSKKAEAATAQITLLQTEYDGPSLPGLQEADLKSKFTWLFGQLK
ncbi:MAG TPA: hypothetical protein VK843_17770 [Planctomycetota bacterium]|nr:hypothetical protein [Planctomycetota bacterium]